MTDSIETATNDAGEHMWTRINDVTSTDPRRDSKSSSKELVMAAETEGMGSTTRKSFSSTRRIRLQSLGPDSIWRKACIDVRPMASPRCLCIEFFRFWMNFIFWLYVPIVVVILLNVHRQLTSVIDTGKLIANLNGPNFDNSTVIFLQSLFLDIKHLQIPADLLSVLSSIQERHHCCGFYGDDQTNTTLNSDKACALFSQKTPSQEHGCIMTIVDTIANCTRLSQMLLWSLIAWKVVTDMLSLIHVLYQRSKR